MKLLAQRLWNEPILVLTILVLTAQIALVEIEMLPEWSRVTLIVVIGVGGLLGARAAVSPTDTYRAKLPARLNR